MIRGMKMREYSKLNMLEGDISGVATAMIVEQRYLARSVVFPIPTYVLKEN